ncbi:MAG: LysR family transcriptional regulator [Clostridia bacterium]|nr:LysR family transcriptional regulator [Clostridia bacterium]
MSDYVYEVYKEKSFTNAAKNLFISQPALSTAIKKIENELGVELFDRSSSPVVLTDAGEAYIKALEEIKVIEKNLEYELNDITNLEKGYVSISAANFISSYIIPRIILTYKNRFPKIDIELIESNSSDLHERLLAEETELLIDYSFDERLFKSYTLMEEQVLLSVPNGNPLNRKFTEYAISKEDFYENKYLNSDYKTVDLRKFSDEPYIFLKAGNNTHDMGLKLCKSAGFKPRVSLYLDQLMTSYNFSTSGMGIAFITDTVIRNTNNFDASTIYSLGTDAAKRTVYIGHKRNRYISKAVKQFISVAIEVCSSFGNGFSNIPKWNHCN